MGRGDLSDVEWARWKGHRRVINGILFRLRTGVPWRDLPTRFGKWQTVYDRHRRWSADGTWEKVLRAVQADADAEGRIDWTVVSVDSTVCRAHQHAAGARKRPPRLPGSTLEYLPKQWNRNNSTDGDITSYTIYTSTDGVTFTQAATATGTWAGNATTKLMEWTNRNVGFLRIQVNAATGGYANIGGVRIGSRSAKPALVSSAFPGDSTVYKLVNRNSGKVADVYNFGTANGANIQQWPWLNNTAQKWTFVSTGDGYFKIRNVNSGKLMEVAGLSRVDGGNVGIWADADVPQQHWALTPTGDGHYFLTNRLSGLSLNVDAASTADGANINQYTYTNAAREQWRIVSV